MTEQEAGRATAHLLALKGLESVLIQRCAYWRQLVKDAKGHPFVAPVQQLKRSKLQLHQVRAEIAAVKTKLECAEIDYALINLGPASK